MISYNKVEALDHTKFMDHFKKILKSNFENDPELNLMFSKLSDQYNEFRGMVKFPNKHKSNQHKTIF